MLEAMSAGVPVVARAMTEMPNIIKNGDNGFVSNKPDVLAERVEMLLHDKALARELGKHARQTIREKFAMDRFVRQWNEVLSEVVT
jgi:glycosyltransferase involved in cell wall biosynthesis